MKRGFLHSAAHDTAVTLLLGCICVIILFVVLLIAGLLFNSFEFQAALVVVRGGMLVFGALELFVSAGLLLWPRNGEKVRDSAQWKKRFQVFGLFPVLLLTAVIILTAASFVDYYLYFL